MYTDLPDGSPCSHQPVKKGMLMRKFAKEQKRQIAALAAKKDAEIDRTEMPDAVDRSAAELGSLYRPANKPVTTRLDHIVVEWLKSCGAGYQTRANSLLRHAMESARTSSPKRRKSA
jgi:uncharacterized protein (DUF4415 family)